MRNNINTNTEATRIEFAYAEASNYIMLHSTNQHNELNIYT